MLTGEFEFGNLDIHETSNYIIFVLFVFLITIVLFNLLNALAVSDTQVSSALDFCKLTEHLKLHQPL